VRSNAEQRLRIAQTLRAAEAEAAARQRLLRQRPELPKPSLRRAVGRSLIRLGERIAAEPPRRRLT